MDNVSSLYAKIWCTIMNDSWFRELSAIERSVWLQLIIVAKRDGDTPYIFRRKMLDLCTEFALDKRTLSKILAKMHQKCKIKLTEENNNLKIEIVNYNHHQHLRNSKIDKSNKNVTKMLQKSPYIILDNIREDNITEKDKNHLSEQKEDKDSLVIKEKCKNFVKCYHKYCPSLSSVKLLTDSRIKTIKIRLKEKDDQAWWIEYWQKIEKSDFLTGRKGTWKAGFDWLLKPSNMAKVIEGNYDNHYEYKDPLSAAEEAGHYAEHQHNACRRKVEKDNIKSVGDIIGDIKKGLEE